MSEEKETVKIWEFEFEVKATKIPDDIHGSLDELPIVVPEL